MLSIGAFVKGYSAGYWQLIDIKPKIATEDYVSESICWKKGEVIGQWAILKKAFTPKMKPRIGFGYEDFSWLRPVSAQELAAIEDYFAQNPDFARRFADAPVKLPPGVTNCWLALPPHREADFRLLMQRLPPRFTAAEFWVLFAEFRQFAAKPSSENGYVLNFLHLPWEMTADCDPIYYGCELIRL